MQKRRQRNGWLLPKKVRRKKLAAAKEGTAERLAAAKEGTSERLAAAKEGTSERIAAVRESTREKLAMLTGQLDEIMDKRHKLLSENKFRHFYRRSLLRGNREPSPPDSLLRLKS